jgi:uncharacterized protein (DUF2062 family)
MTLPYDSEQFCMILAGSVAGSISSTLYPTLRPYLGLSFVISVVMARMFGSNISLLGTQIA